MSSFNDGYKIILIDDVENLNLNSVNALLKIIEEPNNKVLFFLIHDIQKKIFDTFKSRCIQFKLNLPNNFKEKIINSLTDDNFYSQLNPHFKTYYSTPGEYINFYYFCIDNNIDFVNTNIEDFLRIVLSNSLYKKNNYIKENLNYFLELFFIKKINHLSSKDKIYDLYNYFIKKINAGFFFLFEDHRQINKFGIVIFSCQLHNFTDSRIKIPHFINFFNFNGTIIFKPT